MRFRKLRIAWSVVWGLLAVLLIVLWVRSYWCKYTFRTNDLDNRVVVFSAYGNIHFRKFGDTAISTCISDGWEFQSELTEDLNEFKGSNGFQLLHRPGYFDLSIPYRFPVMLSATLTVAPWLRFRFSLRTLLIATTLVAVVLGLIVAVV
jgi:hypothetical protein